jgi:hypothetical protein
MAAGNKPMGVRPPPPKTDQSHIATMKTNGSQPPSEKKESNFKMQIELRD